MEISDPGIGRRIAKMIASHKEAEQILQNMPEGIVIVDMSGEVKFMN